MQTDAQEKPAAGKSTADLSATRFAVSIEWKKPSLSETIVNYFQKAVNWRPVKGPTAAGCLKEEGTTPVEKNLNDGSIPSQQIDAEVNWPVEPDSSTPVLTDDEELWILEGERSDNRYIISDGESFTTEHWQDEDFSGTSLAWVLGGDTSWLFPNISDLNLACFPDMVDTTPGQQCDIIPYACCDDPNYGNLARCPDNPNNRLKLYLMSFLLVCYKKVNAQTVEEIDSWPVVITTMEELEANPNSGLEVGAICGENPRPIYIRIPDACTAPGQLFVDLLDVRFAADPRNSDPNGSYATGIDPYVFYAPAPGTVDASQIVDPETY
jgi:hypothetical protein